MTSRACALQAFVLASACHAARAAAEAPSFPNALTSEAVIAWLRSETDLSPSTVVAISSTAVTSILTVTPREPSRWRVKLGSEALSSAAYEEDRVLSWTATIEVDCRTRRAMLASSTVFPERGLGGEGRERPIASSLWINPVVNGAAYNVMMRVCEGKPANPLYATAGGRSIAPVSAVKHSLAGESGASAAQTSHRSGPAPSAGADREAPSTATPRVSVQVSASATTVRAERELARVKDLGVVPAGVTPRVERVALGERIVYRAQFDGFDGRGQAAEFCRRLLDKGVGCLVRSR